MVIKLGGPPSGTELARVGHTVITVEEFEQKVAQQGPFARPRFQDPRKRREFLDALIRQEVLAQEAIAKGMAQDPDVMDAIKKVMVQKLTRQEYDGLVKQEDIKTDEIRAYYDEHAEEFHKPPMMRCGALVFLFGADQAAARGRAQAALKKVKAEMASPAGRPLHSDPFQDLAASISEDAESKALRGDLKFLSAEELAEKYGKPVADACFGLQNINDLTDVVEGTSGFFVLRHTGSRRAIDRTFEQVESQIRNRLFRERRTKAFNDYVEGLRTKATVTVDEKRLNSMNFGGPQRNDPAMPPPSLPPSRGEPAGEQQDPNAH